VVKLQKKQTKLGSVCQNILTKTREIRIKEKSCNRSFNLYESKQIKVIKLIKDYYFQKDFVKLLLKENLKNLLENRKTKDLNKFYNLLIENIVTLIDILVGLELIKEKIMKEIS